MSPDPVVVRKIQIKLNTLMAEATPAKYERLMEDVIENATMYLAVTLLQPQLLKVCTCRKNVFVQCELWCEEILRKVTQPCICSRHMSAQTMGTSNIPSGVNISVTQCPFTKKLQPMGPKPTCPSKKPNCDSTTSYFLYSTGFPERTLSPGRLTYSLNESQSSPDSNSIPSPIESNIYEDLSYIPQKSETNFNNENTDLPRPSALDSSSCESYHTSHCSDRSPDKLKKSSELSVYWQTKTQMFATVHPYQQVLSGPNAPAILKLKSLAQTPCSTQKILNYAPSSTSNTIDMMSMLSPNKSKVLDRAASPTSNTNNRLKISSPNRGRNLDRSPSPTSNSNNLLRKLSPTSSRGRNLHRAVSPTSNNMNILRTSSPTPSRGRNLHRAASPTSNNMNILRTSSPTPSKGRNLHRAVSPTSNNMNILKMSSPPLSRGRNLDRAAAPTSNNMNILRMSSPTPSRGRNLDRAASPTSTSILRISSPTPSRGRNLHRLSSPTRSNVSKTSPIRVRHSEESHSPTPMKAAEAAKRSKDKFNRKPLITTDQMADWHAMLISLIWNVNAWRDWIQENIDHAVANSFGSEESWTSFKNKVNTEAIQWRQYNKFSTQLILRLTSRYKEKTIVSPTRGTIITKEYKKCQSDIQDVIYIFNCWTHWLFALIKKTDFLQHSTISDISLNNLKWRYFGIKIKEYLDDWTKYNLHLKLYWEQKYSSILSGCVPKWNNPGPVWVVSACGTVPSGAVSAGVCDGEIIWVARTTHKRTVMPAALYPSKHCCLVYTDSIHHYTKYQVLCNADVNWIPWNSGSICNEAVLATVGIYIGRVMFRESHLLGAVCSPTYYCQVIIYGKPVSFNSYELLTHTHL